MLKKLLKYDLQWQYKDLIVIYFFAFFFAVVTRIIEGFEQTSIWMIVYKICYCVTIALIINILINYFKRNWDGFVKSIYKDESYLTHTLPVTKNKIFLSKILTATITLFTSFIVIVFCMAIVFLNKNILEAIKENLEESAIFLNCSILSLIIILVITVFLEFLFLTMSGILGIIIGHKSNNLKIEKSIAIGFGTYMGFSIMSIVIIYIAGLLNSDIMSVFNNMEVSSNALKSIMIMGIVLYAIYTLIVYFVGNKLLNKGVNVD